MSYTQHFHDSISVYGSKSVSYPKSDSGGTMTVSYSETVPLDITVNVETAPFDNSVSNCNGSIDVLTGTVIAMNGTQVAAIQETTRKVSQSLIDGFFGTINTELSQQLQALDSAIQAGAGLIAEQGKAVSAQKRVMETDYNRISSRYAALFQNLDDECHKRIYALDKYSFNLARNVQKKLLLETGANTAAGNVLGIQDESSSKLMLLISRLKRIVHDVLNVLRMYVGQETAIAVQIDSFMLDEKIEGKRTEYMPVIWVEQEDLGGNAADRKCYMPDSMPENKKDLAAQSVDRRFTSETRWYAASEEERNMLDREIMALAESAFAGAPNEKELRVYDKIIELWRNGGPDLFHDNNGGST
ncbi:MAG: hypothetical protein LBC57_10520 [Treponema sp.]|jgi:hypothetical protein|nr:hypothetical protein [Treponema sp.]